jgi:hypothetical protein
MANLFERDRLSDVGERLSQKSTQRKPSKKTQTLNQSRNLLERSAVIMLCTLFSRDPLSLKLTSFNHELHVVHTSSLIKNTEYFKRQQSLLPPDS